MTMIAMDPNILDFQPISNLCFLEIMDKVVRLQKTLEETDYLNCFSLV